MTKILIDEAVVRQALEALSPWAGEDANHTEQYAAYHAIREALAEQTAQPEFFTHNVEHPYDWSEWVCPDPKGYLMKCCDCGLVHEVEFGVVRYKSETEREDCEMVDDPNLQAVFRMRRSEKWSPTDTAHRAGGLPMEQPAPAQCRHRIADARNPLVKSGYLCVDCGGLFAAADHTEQPAPAQEPVAITEQMAFAFHNAITDGALGTDDMMDIMRGLEAAFAHITTPPAPAPAQPLTDSELLERLANATPEQIDAWLTIARQHDHKKHRQPLTDEQIKDVAASCMWWVREQDILDDAIELARAIEAAHGIKGNT